MYHLLFGKKLWRLWRPLSKKLRSKSKSKQPQDCRFTPPLILYQLSGEKSMKKMPGSTGMCFTSGIKTSSLNLGTTWTRSGANISWALGGSYIRGWLWSWKLFSHWLRCMQMFLSMHAIFQQQLLTWLSVCLFISEEICGFLFPSQMVVCCFVTMLLVTLLRRWVQAVFRLSDDTNPSTKTEAATEVDHLGQEKIVLEVNEKILKKPVNDLEVDISDGVVMEMSGVLPSNDNETSIPYFQLHPNSGLS
ncbi:uncharacterized protein LOC103955384 [Pyrus x bretschneideri]|uniref:uncharacterized protein LOC103955384 n=1 Tax=Pyrus x bretschneideri TaxID=225117 RepID=UPI00202DC0F4|nr:uncharacterized protein LOC103955384 [Pyrus x bretschneideri]